MRLGQLLESYGDFMNETDHPSLASGGLNSSSSRLCVCERERYGGEMEGDTDSPVVRGVMRR